MYNSNIESAHEDIDLVRVNTEIITDTATMRTNRSDRVGFVNVEVKL